MQTTTEQPPEKTGYRNCTDNLSREDRSRGGKTAAAKATRNKRGEFIRKPK